MKSVEGPYALAVFDEKNRYIAESSAIQCFQRTSPVPIEVEDVMWVPDFRIATTIAQAVLATIARHRATGGWHDVPAASVAGSSD
ncbi:hypothetical protein [Tardiphaga sp. P9-11]|uniref:hypothetical protein n=1 Tax=Tardiphaga sp. P9-11 TaxID=2024614 RepID=UPI0011F3E406|nr:hypothetical protein [Tardiphaga sp. P9-11]KAA0073015.1 hypothetical protein CIW50_22765 [Tardiphaga sp. P9-11]